MDKLPSPITGDLYRVTSFNYPSFRRIRAISCSNAAQLKGFGSNIVILDCQLWLESRR
jgi:hypothetical protein